MSEIGPWTEDEWLYIDSSLISEVLLWILKDCSESSTAEKRSDNKKVKEDKKAVVEVEDKKQESSDKTENDGGKSRSKERKKSGMTCVFVFT